MSTRNEQTATAEEDRGMLKKASKWFFFSNKPIWSVLGENRQTKLHGQVVNL